MLGTSTHSWPALAALPACSAEVRHLRLMGGFPGPVCEGPQPTLACILAPCASRQTVCMESSHVQMLAPHSQGMRQSLMSDVGSQMPAGHAAGWVQDDQSNASVSCRSTGTVQMRRTAL